MDLTEEDLQVLRSLVQSAITRETMADYGNGSADMTYVKVLDAVDRKLIEAIMEVGK